MQNLWATYPLLFLEQTSRELCDHRQNQAGREFKMKFSMFKAG